MASASGPPYAIEYTEVACGKTFAKTKRRLRWRFGFADAGALADGRSGAACRGEEHVVTLVWSVSSGKVLIVADSQEVHYSYDRDNKAVVDVSWTMGGHDLRLQAHASMALVSERESESAFTEFDMDPCTRQFDLFVDRRSYFLLPKVHRLGRQTSPSVERHAQAAARSEVKETPALRSNSEMEDFHLRQALEASREVEKKRRAGEKVPRRLSEEATELLIDFFNDFDCTSKTPPPAPSPAGGGDEWALALTANPSPGNKAPAPGPASATEDPFAAPSFAAPSYGRPLSGYRPASTRAPASADPFSLATPSQSAGAPQSLRNLAAPVTPINPFDSGKITSKAAIEGIKEAMANPPPEQGAAVATAATAKNHRATWGGFGGAPQQQGASRHSMFDGYAQQAQQQQMMGGCAQQQRGYGQQQ